MSEPIMMRYGHTLPDGTATLLLEAQALSAEDVDDLFAVLQVVKTTLRRRVAAATGAPEAPPVEEE